MRSVDLVGAWCHERLETFNAPVRLDGLKRETVKLGPNPTSKCAQSHHSTCSGRHRCNHGQPGQRCTCECHNPAQAA